jgi:hypothetical protein
MQYFGATVSSLQSKLNPNPKKKGEENEKDESRYFGGCFCFDFFLGGHRNG